MKHLKPGQRRDKDVTHGGDNMKILNFSHAAEGRTVVA